MKNDKLMKNQKNVQFAEDIQQKSESKEHGELEATKKPSGEVEVPHKSQEQSVEPVEPKKPEDSSDNKESKRRVRWITRAMAEESGREDVLKTTLIESIFHAFFVIVVTLYALNIGNSSWFYLIHGLKQQFVGRNFYTLNNVAITFQDIRTAADFWFYIENHLIGSFFWESTYAEENRLPNIDENDMNILYENKVLGVPRIRQVRVRNDSCVIHEYFQRIFLNCYDQYEQESKDTETFGPGDSSAWWYSDVSITKSRKYGGKITTYGGGGFYIDFPKNKNQTTELFRSLKENLWITRGTRAIFIDFTTFNANIDTFAICKIVFEFPSSGGVIPSVDFRSVHLTNYIRVYNWFILSCEILVYLCVFLMILENLRELFYYKLKYFKFFWTYVDTAIITCSLANVGFSILKIKHVPETIETFKNNPYMYGNFEYFRHLHILQNDIIATNLFLVYIKIFYYLNFNRTMGQLNNTLRKCAWDILGFSVMFFIIFFAFAELGYLVFGSQVESFSSFGIAMFTLLRTILGDFNYTEIEEANRILAPIFFLSYIFLVFFVLLNMFLAIINDTYADVKTEIAIAPDEMQMTEYLKKGFLNFLRKLGCKRASTSEMKRELNVTIRHIREALKKCGFSDLEIEMFFARYNIDPIAEVEHYDVEKLLAELEAILRDVARKEGGLDEFVHVNDFVAQQERLEEIDKTIGLLVTQVKTLLMKLEKMENVKKLKANA